MQRVPELVVGLAFLIVSFEMMAQKSATHTSAGEAFLSSEEEEASYEIYSTVLKVKEPAVLDWTIVRETRAFPMCLEPAREQQATYRPMIDDYGFRNRKTLVLQPKFKLGAYTLVGPEAWASAQSITRNQPRKAFAVFLQLDSTAVGRAQSFVSGEITPVRALSWSSRSESGRLIVRGVAKLADGLLKP